MPPGSARPSHPLRRLAATAAVLALVATACASDSDQAGRALADGEGDGSATPAADVDLTRLPIGDAVSTSPTVGAVYACETSFGGGGAHATGDWISDDGTWDFTAKPTVDGSVGWDSEFEVALDGDTRRIMGNALPTDPTGEFPVDPADDAYGFDRNPNSIAAQDLVAEVPATPEVAGEAECVSLGAVGVLLNGGWFFNALDGEGRDAVAYEIQDGCEGHPEQSGGYHYHWVSTCVEGADEGAGHSDLVGYVFDGFGLFGHRGEDGSILTSSGLDECHGHTHEIEWDGETVEMFHYHATFDYPYAVGCYRGTPTDAAGVGTGGGGGGGPPGGGPPPR